MPELWHAIACRIIDYNLEVFAQTSLIQITPFSVQIEATDIGQLFCDLYEITALSLVSFSEQQ